MSHCGLPVALAVVPVVRPGRYLVVAEETGPLAVAEVEEAAGLLVVRAAMAVLA